MLDKQLWNDMTESQRQFVLLGIQIERIRITKLIRETYQDKAIIELIEKKEK
jgi:hypothetical protein